MNKLTIKNWDEQDRPREKLLNKGRLSLSDAELLAILIGSGSRDETAVELCKRILKYADNDLTQLGSITSTQLVNNFKGVGEAKALTIIAALELGRRRSETQLPILKKISCSKDLFQLMYPMLENLKHEEFWCLLLSRSNQVIRQIKISQGGISGTVVDNRIILKHAIENSCSGIAICHNHPSGNLSPSPQDISITNKLKEACKLVDFVLIDHLIISDKGYFSFVDENLL